MDSYFTIHATAETLYLLTVFGIRKMFLCITLVHSKLFYNIYVFENIQAHFLKSKFANFFVSLLKKQYAVTLTELLIYFSHL